MKIVVPRSGCHAVIKYVKMWVDDTFATPTHYTPPGLTHCLNYS